MPVGTVSAPLQLAQVKQRYRNGAVDLYKFNVESMVFEEESTRLPPVQTKMEAYQRFCPFASQRPRFVGERVRLLFLSSAVDCAFRSSEFDEWTAPHSGNIATALFDNPNRPSCVIAGSVPDSEIHDAIGRLGRPRWFHRHGSNFEAYDRTYQGSRNSELAMINSIDLSARVAILDGLVTLGTASVTLFNVDTMCYDGIILDVPLHYVFGLGFFAALAEARAVATAELCRLTGLDPAAEFDVSEFDGKEFDRIEDLFDVKELAALVSSWTQADPAVVAAIHSRQSEAEFGTRMQAIMHANCGWPPQTVAKCREPPGTNPSFHFDRGFGYRAKYSIDFLFF